MNDIVIKMGEGRVCPPGSTLRTSGVGSCIVIILYDAKTQYGAMAHAMLCSERGSDVQKQQFPLRYVEIATRKLVELLEKNGVHYDTLQAWIVGGAEMFASHQLEQESIGMCNVRAAKETLAEIGIPIVQEEVGGHSGRSVSFDTTTGTCSIYSAAAS